MDDESTNDAEAERLWRPLLDHWTVPELPSGLKERVMMRIDSTTWARDVQPDPLPRPRPRPWALGPRGVTVLTMVATAAAAAAVVLALRRPATPEPVAAAVPMAATTATAGADRSPRGHLTLDVTPHDATVELDGAALQGPSPFVATNLAPGKHAVVVRRPGFTPWSRSIDVPEAQLHLPVALVATDDAAALDRTPRSSARLAPASATEVEGKLDKDEIRNVVREHIGDIQTCYQDGLARDATLAGRVAVTFVIAPDGRVRDSVVSESDLGDTAVSDCIARAITTWRFPEPDDGNAVSVVYPFLLESE
ncbi:MAG: TonB family protein [Myxococcales bacterium]|nr:TonB family protein [Myxococcales bacterium]